jgi:hypothetical protein
MKQIDGLLKLLTEAGFTANIWRGSRIYLNGYGRDIKAWIEIDDPDAPFEEDAPYAGCNLKVFSDCEQSRKWLINRAKQVKHEIMWELHNTKITSYVMGEPCKNWEDVGL